MSLNARYPNYPDWWYDAESVNLKLMHLLEGTSKDEHDVNVQVLIQNRLIRKYYFFKYQELFVLLLSIMFKPHWYNEVSSSRFFKKLAYHLFFASLRRKQLIWIRTSGDWMKRISIGFIKNNAELKDPMIGSHFWVFVNRMWKYNVLPYKCLKFRRLIGLFNHKNFQKVIADRAHTDHLNIKCGYHDCPTFYIVDKYGMEKPPPKNALYLQWKNKKTRNPWYICKGCKSTYYCSRRCQKKSWIRDGHTEHGKKLQTYQELLCARSEFN